MKKWIGLGIVGVIVFLGGYYGMGVVTERALQKNIDVLNQSEGVVTVKNYQRGWFHSQADLQWTVSMLQKASDPKSRRILTPKTYTTQVPLKIYHGPVMLVDGVPRFGFGYARSAVVLPRIYEQKFHAEYDTSSTKPVLNITVFVNYFIKTIIHLKVPHFTLVTKNGDSRLEWLGMTAALSVSSHKEDLQGLFQIEGLTWLKNGIKGALGPVSSKYKLHQDSDKVYLGTAQLHVPSVSMTSSDGKHHIAGLKEVEFNSSSDASKGLFGADFSASIAGGVLYDKKYGPSELEVSIKNIDAKTLGNINQKLYQSQHESAGERQRMMLSLITDLPALLNKGAQLNVKKLNLSFPEGQLSGNLEIRLPDNALSNPFQLLQKITGQSHIKVSADLMRTWIRYSIKQKLEAAAAPTAPSVAAAHNMAPAAPTALIESQVTQKTDEKIQALMHLGVLVKEGTDFVIDLKCSDGKLFINGHPFTSNMLII